MTFNARDYVTKMQGKDYLEVKWRLVWFREVHPNGSIITEVVNDDLMKATIKDGEGRVIATGHGSSKKMGVAKNRPYEGAETAAIGRALAHAGFGTQFTDELDEGEHLADSPIERKSNRHELVERYNKLVEKAVFMKLANIPDVTAEMSEEDITALGISLKARIEEKEKAGK